MRWSGRWPEPDTGSHHPPGLAAQPARGAHRPTIEQVIIGVDACGNFPTTSGFESSAVAAATVPAAASAEIAAWTDETLTAWGRTEIGELHAAPLQWDQRRAVCAMLGERGDVHAAVVVTSNLLLRSPEAVSAHRARQLQNCEASLARARTEDGKVRGERVRRLLSGRRLGQSRLSDSEYVLAAMVPPAVVGAIQRAFCFYADDVWRPEMRQLSLAMDEETPATVRYVTESLLPSITDERFRLVTPQRWRDDPVHPLFARARHPDGDGYAPQLLVGDTIDWLRSHDEVAVQVADFAAWVVARTISRPEEAIARECFELLRPVLVGESGRCFERYSIGPDRPEDAALYSHLHSAEQPRQWLERVTPG